MHTSADAEEGNPMLVDPAETDGLDVLEAQMDPYDLRDLYAIAPLPAAMARDADDENEDDDESGDDSDDSEDDSSEDSGESGEDEDEEEDESTAKLIKDLREENKSRRIKLRQATKELDRLKAENARLKKRAGSNPRKKAVEEDDDEAEEEDLTKLTPREEAAEIKSALVDVMSDLDLNKKYRRIITALVDPEELEIEVSDTGKVSVSGLKEAIEELLEDYPEWVNKRDDDDEDEEKVSRRTGPSTNRRKRGSGNGLDRATLAKKYPALANR